MSDIVDPLGQEDVGAVVGSLLDAFESESVAAYKALAQKPEAQKALASIRSSDFDGFYFSLQYPFEQFIDGLLASEFPGDAHDARFIFRNSQFVDSHISRLIRETEGSVCSADKARTVMKSILCFLKTGKEISFDYTKEYTFHLPKKVFTEHAPTMQFFKALQNLYYGNSEPYLKALLAIKMDAESLS